MYDKQTLESLRKNIKFKDPVIFEKTVNAFSLLYDLVQIYPDLIFKGGTSLLLHQFPSLRFSIDIDILLDEKYKPSVVENLKLLSNNSTIFKKVEENVRKSSAIPKVHYKFFYDSHLGHREENVLLDIVFSDHPYYKLVKKNLDNHPLIFKKGKNVIVKVPSPEGLLGDKLGVISPNTIGIPLNDDREIEFVKQILDLSVLFNVSSDLHDIKNSFVNCVKIENGFRGTTHSSDDIFEDILSVAFKYSQNLLKGANNSYKEIEHINRGIGKISNHLVSHFRQPDIKIAFAKIAYICHMIQKEEVEDLIKDVNFDLLEGKVFPEKYTILNGLKKGNMQSYFYWMLGCGTSD